MADFETAHLSQWIGLQIVDDPVNPRALIVPWPVAQGLFALRVLVRQGDDPIHASGNRNELVGSTDYEGSEYYYRWSTLFDDSFPSEPLPKSAIVPDGIVYHDAMIKGETLQDVMP